MADQEPSPGKLTIPNVITLVRILLTPLFIICLIQGKYSKALIVFLLAGASDLADGLVARVWRQKSPLGAFLDPLADKLLLSSSFITLGIFRLVPPWLTVVVCSRDVILAVGVLVFKLVDFPLVIVPTRTGKLTTTVQLATVLLVLVGKNWLLPGMLMKGLFWASGGLTTISGVQYLYRGLRLASQSYNNR